MTEQLCQIIRIWLQSTDYVFYAALLLNNLYRSRGRVSLIIVKVGSKRVVASVELYINGPYDSRVRRCTESS
jgi:hypothetical protein